ncbi:MAG: ABC transporter permease [Candidatus Cryptobacteroides sp.]
MRDLFKEIWSSLRQNKLRTALTGFAVAWGIFMLIALLGAGNGLMNAMTDSGSRMDNSMIVYDGFTTMPYGGYDANRWFGLDTRDLKNLESEKFSSVVDEISPRVTTTAGMTFRDEAIESVTINGIAPIYSKINGVQMVAGRFIDRLDMEERSKVIVISDEDAATLLGGRGAPEDMIGEYVNVNSLAYKVVGIHHKDQGYWGRQAYAPYSLIHALYRNDNYIGQIFFSYKGISNLEESKSFKDAYKKTVLGNHDASPEDLNAVYISDRMEQNAQMAQGTRIVNTALWILGLLTLISGIVGVSNIMLITVKERTHEFGIRKALGASPASILSLILMESILITSFFGAIGMLGGMAVTQVLDYVLSSKATVVAGQAFYIFKDPSVGLGTSLKAALTMIVAGAVAGLIPARKASRVMPIEALRAD